MNLLPKLPWISSLRPLNLGLLVLIAWIVDPSRLLSPFFIALFLLMVLGNLHNDLRDYRADALNRPGSNPFQSKANRRFGEQLLLLGFALWFVFLCLIDLNFHLLGLVAVALCLWAYNFRVQYFPILGNAWLAGIMAFCLLLLFHNSPIQSRVKTWACLSVAAVHFARELFKSLQDQTGDALYKPPRYPLPPVWLYRGLASVSLLIVAAMSFFFWQSQKSPIILGLGFMLPLPWVLFDRNYKRLSALIKGFMLLGLLSLYLCLHSI